MKITIEFLQNNFNALNELYFYNELKMPKFEITHVKSYLGQYHYKRDIFGELVESIIRISDMYDRSEKDIINTLAHEMIHLYIRQNNIRDTRPHHGKIFNMIADRLNHDGGFHISRTDNIEGCGFRNKSDKEFYIACFKCGKNGKYFRFVINQKYLDYYKQKFEKHANHYKDVFVYVSKDDKKYAHYPQCYKSVRGWYIDHTEFEKLRTQEKIIFSYTMLQLKRNAA